MTYRKFESSSTKPKYLVECTTKAECEKFSADDIRRELKRRTIPFNDGTTGKYDTKPMLIQKLLRANKIMGASDAARGAPMAGKTFKGAFPSRKTNPLMYYTTRRDLRDVVLPPAGGVPGDYRGDLLQHATNARSAGAKSKSATLTTGEEYAAEKYMGLFKEKYLTLDHAGLQMRNLKGVTYEVLYDPISDNAYWIKARASGGLNWNDLTGIHLTGTFKVGRDGLPLVSQLDYYKHHGQVARNKSGKIMQVHCYKKNAKGGTSPDNCRTDKSGNIRLRWAAYDPDYQRGEIGLSRKTFQTPLGKYSFDELMTMPLDKIVQMLVILKLADEVGSMEGKLAKHGLTFDAQGNLITKQDVGGPGGPRGNKSFRHGTTLPAWFLEAERRMYETQGGKASGVKKTCPNRKPHRCPFDSVAPGACSHDPSFCYDYRLRDFYMNAGMGDKVAALMGAPAPGGPGLGIYKDAIDKIKSGKGNELTDQQVAELVNQYQVAPATGFLVRRS